MIGKLSGIEFNGESLSQKLEHLYPTKTQIVVIVGFTAAYAIYVHEAAEVLRGKKRPSGIGNYWDPEPQAQSKYLEQPARQLKRELGKIVVQVTKTTGSLERGLIVAGLRLQAAAQKRVPVEYGNLKASAFTRVDK